MKSPEWKKKGLNVGNVLGHILTYNCVFFIRLSSAGKSWKYGGRSLAGKFVLGHYHTHIVALFLILVSVRNGWMPEYGGMLLGKFVLGHFHI